MRKIYKFLALAFHSISLRLPQRYALRSGLRVFVLSKQEHNLFWTLFSSREYIQFLRPLLTLKQVPTTVIDGGAACGYFSLLIEHYVRCGLLPWTITKYTLVEPMSSNMKRLLLNVNANMKERAVVSKGVLGKKSGAVSFQASKAHPWGGRVMGNTSGGGDSISYVDITHNLKEGSCLLKLDIEGAEFDFFETYQADLEQVAAIIVEWHTEFGDYDKAVAILASKGFDSHNKFEVTPNRWLEIFLNKKCT